MVDVRASEKLSEIVNNPRITAISLDWERPDLVSASYLYDGEERDVRIRVEVPNETYRCYRLEVYDRFKRGSIFFDVNPQNRDVWMGGINFWDSYNSGYGGFALYFLKHFLRESGCEGFEIGAGFYQGNKGEEARMVEASQRIFERTFPKVRCRDGVLREVWGTV